MTSPQTPRKQRVSRDFFIAIRSLEKQKNGSAEGGSSVPDKVSTIKVCARRTGPLFMAYTSVEIYQNKNIK